MSEQQIQVRSPSGHLHLSRRYGTAPWKFKGQCLAADLTGLFESAVEVAKKLEDSHEQVEAEAEPPGPTQGEAKPVAQGGHEAAEEGGAPSERVTDAEMLALLRKWWEADRLEDAVLDRPHTDEELNDAESDEMNARDVLRAACDKRWGKEEEKHVSA